jgi:prevent-host-death family protein
LARTIPHRELRNNSSAVLRAVQEGETFEITNNGEVVAILVPPPRRPSPGVRVYPAQVRGGFSELPLVSSDHPVQEDLDDLREER